MACLKLTIAFPFVFQKIPFWKDVKEPVKLTVAFLSVFQNFHFGRDVNGLLKTDDCFLSVFKEFHLEEMQIIYLKLTITFPFRVPKIHFGRDVKRPAVTVAFLSCSKFPFGRDADSLLKTDDCFPSRLQNFILEEIQISLPKLTIAFPFRVPKIPFGRDVNIIT
ncbi:hypothetical protein AVEN_173989-1 [Araneus ventricosus]|uniref:Uncharacterized protein n=1 Tax=Araneus ventricosus TaxID=182803 RepID=A0A4Y2RCB6_ARAVE|nr:hypothetical protein AVEN_173989-1 [Araneus ventricosus]